MTEPARLHGRPAIPAHLQGLRAVVVALFDSQGAVLDANAGFRRIVGAAEDAIDPAAVFLRPALADLLAHRADGAHPVVYEGMVQLGRPGETCRSLVGKVVRYEAFLLLVAEHDIEEQERLGAALGAMNEDLAEMQRELARANRRLRARETELDRLTREDPLTGTANRRQLDERLDEEIARGSRHDRPLSVIAWDLDRFKAINDSLGHEAGDEVLKAAVEVMRRHVRRHDLIARTGGEEFVIVAPDTGLDQAAKLAERLRAALAATSVPAIGRPVTASFGVATLGPGENAAALLRRADQALYEAKRGGRDRVVTAGSELLPAAPIAEGSPDAA